MYFEENEWTCDESNFEDTKGYLDRLLANQKRTVDALDAGKIRGNYWSNPEPLTVDELAAALVEYQEARAAGADELGDWVRKALNPKAWTRFLAALRQKKAKRNKPIHRLNVGESNGAAFMEYAARMGLTQDKALGQLLAVGQLLADRAEATGKTVYDAAVALGLPAKEQKPALDVQGSFKVVWPEPPTCPKNPPFPLPYQFKPEWVEHPQAWYLKTLCDKGYINGFRRKGDRDALFPLVKQAWRMLPPTQDTKGRAALVYVLRDCPDHIKWVETQLKGGRFYIRAPYYWRFNELVECNWGGLREHGVKWEWSIPKESAGEARAKLLEIYGEDGTSEVPRVALRVDCSHFPDGNDGYDRGVLRVAARTVVERISQDVTVDVNKDDGVTKLSGWYKNVGGSPAKGARLGANKVVCMLRDIPETLARKAAAETIGVTLVEVEGLPDHRAAAVSSLYPKDIVKVDLWKLEQDAAAASSSAGDSLAAAL